MSENKGGSVKLILSKKAKNLGFQNVQDVRDNVCSLYREYDTCSVCPYWTYLEHCTLLKEADAE